MVEYLEFYTQQSELYLFSIQEPLSESATENRNIFQHLEPAKEDVSTGDHLSCNQQVKH